MPDRNSPPTPTGRLRLARCIVRDGWPCRQAASPAFSDWYDHHRPHTGIGGRTPAERVPDLPEHHSKTVDGGRAPTAAGRDR